VEHNLDEEQGRNRTGGVWVSLRPLRTRSPGYVHPSLASSFNFPSAKGGGRQVPDTPGARPLPPMTAHTRTPPFDTIDKHDNWR